MIAILQPIQTHTMQQDRNFDAVADHFAHKIYGGLKGKIRLAVLTRDLDPYMNSPTRLQVLDVGAGLAQIGLEFAKRHHVTINDISANMLDKARQAAHAQQLNPRFVVGAYQQLPKYLGDQRFDLILCHAVLEWLSEPAKIFEFFCRYLRPDGVLSLCFYNPASLVYRNLIMGNFYQLDTPKPADSGSLTPNHPVDPAEVIAWLNASGFDIISHTGVRVFFDYTQAQSGIRRGGLAHADAVIDMELKYSTQEPYKHLGRYIHLIAKLRT